MDSSAAPELCATGLRNPWRCSFDRENDDLWCADVGHTHVEEIDIVQYVLLLLLLLTTVEIVARKWLP